MSRSNSNRDGLTLLELLIVLVILAALTTIAVKSLESIGDQARYDQTERTLIQIEEATTGNDSDRQADGTPLISGFVADVGRLPVAIGNDPETQLAEIWDSTSTIATTFPYAVRIGPATPVDYSDVRLPCGWRGPYLRFGVGESDVRDGWGEPFVARNELGNVALDGEAISSVVWQPLAPFSDPLAIDFTESESTVSVTLNNDGSPPSSSATVLLIPNPLTPSELAVIAPDSSTVSTAIFNNVPIGTRAIHATIDGEVVIKYIYVTPDGVNVNLEVRP